MATFVDCQRTFRAFQAARAVSETLLMKYSEETSVRLAGAKRVLRTDEMIREDLDGLARAMGFTIVWPEPQSTPAPDQTASPMYRERDGLNHHTGELVGA